MSPMSWRDVHALVQSSQDAVLNAIAELAQENKREHGDIERRLRSLEDDRTFRSGQKAGEKKILGMARSTFAVIVSIGGVVVTIVRSI